VQAKPPPPVDKPQPPPQLAALQHPASAPKQASADSEPKPLSPMAREVRSQEQLLEQALGGPPPNSLTPSPDPTGQTDQKLPASGAMQGQDDPLRAVAVPSATADGDILVAYKTLVFSKLELAKKYPEEARKRRAHGSAVIDFVLDDKGQVQRVDLVQSSGDQALDAESQSLVFRAAPFPPPPAGAQKEFGAVIVFSPRN
jgi:TonB family protein